MATDYDAVSYVVSSSYREAVIDSLTHPKTPSQIRDTASNHIGLAHISRALGELQEKGYVELLVDEDTKKGRLYDLTEKGEMVAQEFESWDDAE